MRPRESMAAAEHPKSRAARMTRLSPSHPRMSVRRRRAERAATTRASSGPSWPHLQGTCFPWEQGSNFYSRPPLASRRESSLAFYYLEPKNGTNHANDPDGKEYVTVVQRFEVEPTNYSVTRPSGRTCSRSDFTLRTIPAPDRASREGGLRVPWRLSTLTSYREEPDGSGPNRVSRAREAPGKGPSGRRRRALHTRPDAGRVVALAMLVAPRQVPILASSVVLQVLTARILCLARNSTARSRYRRSAAACKTARAGPGEQRPRLNVRSCPRDRALQARKAEY